MQSNETKRITNFFFGKKLIDKKIFRQNQLLQQKETKQKLLDFKQGFPINEEPKDEFEFA